MGGRGSKEEKLAHHVNQLDFLFLFHPVTNVGLGERFEMQNLVDRKKNQFKTSIAHLFVELAS